MFEFITIALIIAASLTLLTIGIIGSVIGIMRQREGMRLEYLPDTAEINAAYAQAAHAHVVMTFRPRLQSHERTAA